MDFNDTPEEAKFRKQCREWLEKNATYKDESTLKMMILLMLIK